MHYNIIQIFHIIFARNNVCFSYRTSPRHSPPRSELFSPYLLIRKPAVQFRVGCSNSLFYFRSTSNIVKYILLRLIVFPFRPLDENLNRQDTIKFYVECRSGAHRFILYTRRFNTTIVYCYAFSNIILFVIDCVCKALLNTIRVWHRTTSNPITNVSLKYNQTGISWRF